MLLVPVFTHGHYFCCIFSLGKAKVNVVVSTTIPRQFRQVVGLTSLFLKSGNLVEEANRIERQTKSQFDWADQFPRCHLYNL